MNKKSKILRDHLRTAKSRRMGLLDQILQAPGKQQMTKGEKLLFLGWYEFCSVNHALLHGGLWIISHLGLSSAMDGTIWSSFLPCPSSTTLTGPFSVHSTAHRSPWFRGSDLVRQQWRSAISELRSVALGPPAPPEIGWEVQPVRFSKTSQTVIY